MTPIDFERFYCMNFFYVCQFAKKISAPFGQVLTRCCAIVKIDGFYSVNFRTDFSLYYVHERIMIKGSGTLHRGAWYIFKRILLSSEMEFLNEIFANGSKVV